MGNMKHPQTSPICMVPECQEMHCLHSWLSEPSADSDCSGTNEGEIVLPRKELFRYLVKHAFSTGKVKTEVLNFLHDIVPIKNEHETSDSEYET